MAKKETPYDLKEKYMQKIQRPYFFPAVSQHVKRGLVGVNKFTHGIMHINGVYCPVENSGKPGLSFPHGFLGFFLFADISYSDDP